MNKQDTRKLIEAKSVGKAVTKLPAATAKTKAVTKEAVAIVNKAEAKLAASGAGNKLAVIKANKITTTTAYPATAAVKVIDKANPHKAGSFRAACFNIACRAKTVGQYLEAEVNGAHCKARYLGRWAAMGKISIA